MAFHPAYGSHQSPLTGTSTETPRLQRRRHRSGIHLACGAYFDEFADNTGQERMDEWPDLTGASGG